MSLDRRLTPSNGRVASATLRGLVEAQRYSEGVGKQVLTPTTMIWHAPQKLRPERELLFGDLFTVLEIRDGFAFGQSVKDGYCGYVCAADLGEATEPTHIVSARTTHVYSAPNIKIPHELALPFGARLSVSKEDGQFSRLADGRHVPAMHLRPVEDHFSDPVAVAELFLGAPYVWGGNSSFGLDCSGLIQAALLACGIPCPGDSDLQEQALGRALADDATIERGDLFFWRGHVAMAVDGKRLIHANAHTMSVAYEPIAPAIARIMAAGDGTLRTRKRL